MWITTQAHAKYLNFLVESANIKLCAWYEKPYQSFLTVNWPLKSETVSQLVCVCVSIPEMVFGQNFRVGCISSDFGKFLMERLFDRCVLGYARSSLSARLTKEHRFFVRSNPSGMVPKASETTGNSNQKCSPECHLCLIHPRPYNENIRAIYFDILTHYFVYEHWIFNTDYFYLCVEILRKCSLMTLSLFRRNIIDSFSLFNVQ